MPVSQEELAHIEDQLALDDGQLALNGIARGIAANSKELSDTQRHIDFTKGYTPRHPGVLHSDGGSDIADYEAEMYHYTHWDEEREEDLENSYRQHDDINERLSALEEDQESAEAGDEGVIAKYAREERERLSAELQKKRAAKEAHVQHEKNWVVYKAGHEVSGSIELGNAVQELVTNPNLKDIQGKESSSCWKFMGTPVDGGNRILFQRSFENGVLPFKASELLSIGHSDEGTEVEFSRVTDIDELAVNRYGENIATGESYKFVLKVDGKVASQEHKTGSVNKHLPHFINNGTISDTYVGSWPHRNYSPEPVLNSEDMTKIQAKVSEVAEAIKELAENR